MYISNIINVIAVALLLSYGDLYDEYISDADSQNYTGFAASLTIILLWLKVMGHFKVRYVTLTQLPNPQRNSRHPWPYEGTQRPLQSFPLRGQRSDKGRNLVSGIPRSRNCNVWRCC